MPKEPRIKQWSIPDLTDEEMSAILFALAHAEIHRVGGLSDDRAREVYRFLEAVYENRHATMYVTESDFRTRWPDRTAEARW